MARPTTTCVRPYEWQLLVSARPNVLLEGAQETTDVIVAEAMGWLPMPHATWRGAAPSGDRPATLVVRSISEFDRDQQHSLLDWLDAPGDRVQVICTTAEPLYPMVGRGVFLENLYYRLNVLRLDVAAAAAVGITH
jgi:Sigma-54 interaction domain